MMGELLDYAACQRETARAPPRQATDAHQLRHAKPGPAYADGNGLYLLVDDSSASGGCLRVAVNGKAPRHRPWAPRDCDARRCAPEATRLRRSPRVDKATRRERRRAQLEQRIMPTVQEAATHVHTERSKTFKTPTQAQWLASLERCVSSDRRSAGEPIEKSDV